MDTSFANRFLSELDYFTNKKRIVLLSPATEEAIRAAEKKLGCTFSPQMTSFLTQFNGGRILGSLPLERVKRIG